MKEKMKLLSLLLILSWSQLNAIDLKRECVDVNGNSVKIVNNSKLHDLAYANIISPKLPKIEINKAQISNLPKPAQEFIFYHECGHHALGHMIYTNKPIIQQEQEADCYGIRASLTLDLVSHSDLPNIQSKINLIGNGDWEHLPGKNRALNLEKCLGEGMDRTKWNSCKKKFYSNLEFVSKTTATLDSLILGCRKKGSKHPDCIQAKELSKQLNMGIQNAISLVDNECPYVMEPKFNLIFSDYVKKYTLLNNN